MRLIHAFSQVVFVRKSTKADVSGIKIVGFLHPAQELKSSIISSLQVFEGLSLESQPVYAKP